MILKIEGNAVEIIEFFNATVEAAIGFMGGVPGAQEFEDIETVKSPTVEVKPKKEAGQATSAPGEKKSDIKLPTIISGPGSRPGLTLKGIRKVDLSGCGNIPEAIEAILGICRISGAYLGGLLGIDKSVFSKARNGTVSKSVECIFKEHFPALKLGDPTSKKTVKKAGRMTAGKGSQVTLDELLAVDLSDCDGIPAVINKLQLKSNVSGTRLAELLEMHASDLSKARKGVTPPFVERAFKQHLQFPAVEEGK